MKDKASFVNFSIGNACNLRCKFCYNDSSREKKQYFEDIEVLKKRLLDYEFIWTKTINLIWGEPLLYPKIFELLEFLKENNFRVTIVSNWVKLADDKFMLSLNVYKEIIDYITISIHSHNSWLEDKITSRKWTFERKIKGVKGLEKYNFRFFFAMVVNNININHLPEIVDFYKKEFNKNIHFQWIISGKNFSKTNIEQLPSYSSVIKGFSWLKNKIYINIVNWIPLCIHFQVKDAAYRIRELDKRFIYSTWNDWKNLLKTHGETNFIWDKCRKCYALWKFCFWPSKKYVEQFWYDEFISLSKENVYNMIKTQIRIKKGMHEHIIK